MARKKKGLELDGVEIIEVVDEKAAERARKKREKQEKKDKLKGKAKAKEAEPETAVEFIVLEPVVEEPVIEEPAADLPVVGEPVVEEPAASEPVVEESVVDEPVVVLTEESAEESIEETEIENLELFEQAEESQTEAPAEAEDTEEAELDFLRNAMQLDPVPESEESELEESVMSESVEQEIEESVMPEFEESVMPESEESVMPESEESESVMPESEESVPPELEESVLSESAETESDIASIFESPVETAAETAVITEETPEDVQDDLNSLFADIPSEAAPAAEIQSEAPAEAVSPEASPAGGIDLSGLFQETSADLPESEEAADGKKKKAKKKRKDKNQPMFISLDDENAAKLMGLSERPKQKKPKNGPFGFKKIPGRIYVAVICVLAAAVLGGAAFLFITLNNLTNIHLIPEERPHEIVLDNSVTAPNAFNHLFTNIPIPLEGINLSILRLAFDDSAAEVQFNREFDFSRYDIRLTDSFGRESALNALYIDYDGSAAFPERAVRFSPITVGSLGFTLDFRDNWSGEETYLTFAFTTHHGLTAHRNFERLLGLRDSAGNVVGAVQSGTFASTGSRFYFTLDTENRGYGLRFEPELGSSAVSLVEHGRSILPLMGDGPVQLHSLGTNSILGRADFRPIQNLSGNVELVFSRLFTEIPINETLNAFQFFYPNIITGVPDPDRFAILEAGDYRIVIRYLLPSANHEFRLVFHAIDINAPVEYEEDRSNRREVLLDCRLVFTMATGERVVLEAARGLSSNVGSNVFFRPEDSPFGRQILTGQFRSMELEIEGALIVLDDIVVNIDLDLIVHDDDYTFEVNTVRHFERHNAHRERYSAAVIAYERIGSNYRAIMRELWHENGSFVVVTSEIYGSVDMFAMRLEENTELHRSYGIR